MVLHVEFIEGEFSVYHYVQIFLIMFKFWVDHVAYASRFGVDDLYNKWFSAVYMAGRCVLRFTTMHLT